ncbi:ABC transporter substrate-binding protein [Paenibacillus senegalensis]|uniref:ABC transporter substrate-binding protein n=1 Tax=Paenibacillus senegalensis TaxID=1465766 RepID=UPI0002F35289|nr:ABC transporter substrate-binding protein [Paenibacillus senegalensis]
MRIAKTVLTIAAATAIFLTGCSSSSPSASPSPSSEPGQTEQPGSDKTTLTIALPTEVTSMDLYSHGDHVTLYATNNMFNFLLKRLPNGDITEDLVESYENLDDYTWDFKLKQGVKFHTGEELTAEDVKFTLERAAQDATLNVHSTFKTIKEVNVLDPYHFQIITHEPDPLIPGLLARPNAGIYSKKYIEEHGWDHYMNNPVGTGPYKFVEWKRGSHISFEPFAEYFEGPNPDWEKVVYRIIPESSTRVGELVTGGVDLIPNVTSNTWDQIRNNEGTDTISSVSQRVAFIVPRATEGSPTADPRVREAIELAIDNQAIIDSLLGGAANPTRTRVTPGNFAANEELFDTYLHDVERAKELLKEAGYENGVELTMQSSNGRYARDKEVAEMIVGMLSNVGINVKLELMEWTSYLELRNAKKVGDLHMVWFGNSFYDAHTMVTEHLSSTRSMESLGYENQELEDLLRAAAVNMNPEERKEQYLRAQEIVADMRMNIYVYLEHNTYGVSDDIVFEPRIDEKLLGYEIRRR